MAAVATPALSEWPPLQPQFGYVITQPFGTIGATAFVKLFEVGGYLVGVAPQQAFLDGVSPMAFSVYHDTSDDLFAFVIFSSFVCRLT